MIPGIIITPIKINKDDRGWLGEFYRTDETDYRPAMTYVSETLPGISRGPHEHLDQSDLFIFLAGEFTLYLWDNREGAKNYRVVEQFNVGSDNPCSVLVPPGVVHGYKCISSIPGLVINMPDRLYKGKDRKEEVDEVRWEKDPDSPFKI